jgi:hypothetical protein
MFIMYTIKDIYIYIYICIYVLEHIKWAVYEKKNIGRERKNEQKVNIHMNKKEKVRKSIESDSSVTNYVLELSRSPTFRDGT